MRPTIDNLLADNVRLLAQVARNNEQIAALRLANHAPNGLRYEDFVGKRVAVTLEFLVMIKARGYTGAHGNSYTVQHVNTTLTGHTANLVSDSGVTIYHVPESLAFDMRREYMRIEGEGGK